MSTSCLGNLETAKYRAVSGASHAFGRTPEEAVHVLMKCLPEQLPAPIVIWPFNVGDTFFSDEQINRLRELREKNKLSREERCELEELIDASFEASAARASAIQSIKT